MDFRLWTLQMLRRDTEEPAFAPAQRSGRSVMYDETE
jgi:hypothetical protein